ncbi:MAG: 3-deoxy-7-phosphoheptulonate synthase [bacterium]|nr:3-deoxy-7-phosphoheptulonate synthase [bacterium]
MREGRKRVSRGVDEWSPGSWRRRPALQQPEYADPRALAEALKELRGDPPLVFSGEIERLKERIAQAGMGKGFILQGGYCAERFADCRAEVIANQLRVLLQMSVILTHGARQPVIRIGRIAGQYAKPRSSPVEEVKGKELPSYRGDSVNAISAEEGARRPDPRRLVQAYERAALTLNYIRAMIDGGFADLHDPYKWNLRAIERSREWPEYRETVEQILDAIHFMESFGGVQPERLGRVEFYISHEGLLLPYEEALTRRDPELRRYYNVGAHMLWIGNRTRGLDGAHVEYFRGIGNPIGVKVDAGCGGEELVALVRRLNPGNEAGRVCVITRLGRGRATDVLPGLVRAVQRAGLLVTWCCDPMHGNTRVVGGRKTRAFGDILAEVRETFLTHVRLGSRLAGVHFELTGEDVTECTGGAVGVTRADLSRNYQSYCDPRLNSAQSLEMAFLLTKLLREHTARGQKGRVGEGVSG